MAKYIDLTDRFKRNYLKLPKNLKELFNKKLVIFRDNPLHPSFKIHKYKTKQSRDIWEAYLNKNYRFTFEITKEAYIFRNIGQHSIIDKDDV